MVDVSRYTDTTELVFDVEFITPAFLGGADGNAEIRTAPFKNLIRRWWRIVKGNLNPNELWQKESELFGSTEKNPDTVEQNKTRKKSEKEAEVFGKSKVDLKIRQISPSDEYKSSAPIDIGRIESKFGSMDLSKYLGYGSVGIKEYIKPKTKCTFVLTAESKYKNEIIDSLFLITLFGTCGSKSKNGFGSINVIPKQNSFEFNPPRVFGKFGNWKEILNSQKKYPYKICTDKNGVLAWKTNNFNSWNLAFEEIGLVYHDALSFIKAKIPNGRKIFGMAKGNLRLPSQVIIKICPQKIKIENSIMTKYYGLIIHIPYEIEKWDLEEQNQAGCLLHDYLDKDSRVTGWQRKITGAAK